MAVLYSFVGDRTVGQGEAAETMNEHGTSGIVIVIAFICAVWTAFIIIVQFIGFTQLFRHYSSVPAPGVSLTLPADRIPHVTVIRPVKGLEPQLYECLAATFHQTYPVDKLTISFCVPSRSDPAYPTLQRLLEDFPAFDARIYVEEEDPNLAHDGGQESRNLGPNPKIRNMSRAYREAKGDIAWVIDCNVWIGRGVAVRMVDKLCGFRSDGKRAKPYKFVHLIPLVVDSVGASAGEDARGLLHDDSWHEESARSPTSTIQAMLRSGGGRLEEMFMACSHSKFYVAINTVAVAPCIVGKSNMFRRSHLNALTSGTSPYSPGIDYFSDNICEDHLIGDLLWRKKVPAELNGERYGKHEIVFGDVAIQPMAGMSVRDYAARRVRWLRVRKWTVTLATLVEPGVESFLCSAYGAFAITTLPWFHDRLGLPTSWAASLVYWFFGVLLWMIVDWFTYRKLHSVASVELDRYTPSFARPPHGSRRPFREWIVAWLGREVLALPIWIVAVLGGATVQWRNRKFWVGMDMKVHEIRGRRA